MPRKRLKMIAEGIFFSVLNYGIEVYGNVWGTVTLDEQQRNSVSFTKEDNRRLQILVNRVLRCLTNSDRDTSTIELHARSNQLSVQQRCAFFSLMSVHKIMKTTEPYYHFTQLQCSQREHSISTRNRGALRIDYRLSLSRSSFFYRSSRLYNCLPADLVNEVNLANFKRRLKEWVQKNINIVPL